MSQEETQIDDITATLVYEELGYQIDNIDNVIESYEENDLIGTESHEKLEQRRARFAQMRGFLQSITEKELN